MAGAVAAWRGAGPSSAASTSWGWMAVMEAVAAVAWPRTKTKTQMKTSLAAATATAGWQQAVGSSRHAPLSMRLRRPWAARPCLNCGIASAAVRGHGYRLYSSSGPPRVPPLGKPQQPQQQQQLEGFPVPFSIPASALPPVSPPAGEPADTRAPAETAKAEAEAEAGQTTDGSTSTDAAADNSNTADPLQPEDERLPSAAESRRTRLGAGFSRVMDELQGRVLVASQTLNDLTGYSAIEQIKARNAELEAELATAQTTLHEARREYQAVNERRASTQREVTTLLARKDTWAPADLERFTGLYRHDHELEAAAARAVERLQEAEAAESRLSADVTAGILKRYHEEQVWSDRIRRQSTWGTWGLMAVNVVLFIVLQFFAEPWRRSRLMRGIAEAESGVLDDVRAQLADVQKALAGIVGTVGDIGDAAGRSAAAAADLPPQVPGVPRAVGASGTAASPPVPEEAKSPAVPVLSRAESREYKTTSLPPSLPPPSSSPSSSSSHRFSYSLGSLRKSMPSWMFSWNEAKRAAAPAVDLARWEAWLADLCSERSVQLRMRDVSLIAIQSAAAGASLVGTIVFLACRRT